MSEAALAEMLGPGLRVLERGWLSSNNVVLDDGDGLTLIDSGHSAHAAQTVALLRELLGGRRLLQLVNTHLHSDHCGGNAALQREFGCRVLVPHSMFDAVRAWDGDALSHAPTRQRCDRFSAHGSISPGEVLAIGDRRWQVLAAPGHDPHSVLLFDARRGVLISADALWESGFGVVFPELEGEPGFDDVAAVLDLIETLPVRVVIPGHGAPFTDTTAALARARSRLAAYRADPARHRHHAAKVLLKFHLLEEQREDLAALRRWIEHTPYLHAIWARQGCPDARFTAWGERLLRELAASGALVLRDGEVHNA